MTRKPQVPNFKKATARLREAPSAALKMVRAFADVEAQAFRERIENGDFESFDATPLSDDWLAYKAAHHLDLRTMIATKTYVGSIRVFTRQTPGGTLVYVGFDEADRAVDPVTKQPTPFPLYLLAAVQEFGSAKSHVPPRPHWGPHLQAMKERAVAVRSAIQTAVTMPEKP